MYGYHIWCVVPHPPIVAIGLALWTKQTIFSLFIAVWLGSTMMNGFNPLVGFVKIISDYVIPSLSGNASLIVLVTLSGGMIAMLRHHRRRGGICHQGDQKSSIPPKRAR